MVKVTTKTKKADLVIAVVERNLFSEEEANKMTCEDLRRAVMGYDSTKKLNDVVADIASKDKNIKDVVDSVSVANSVNHAESVDKDDVVNSKDSKIVAIPKVVDDGKKKRKPLPKRGDKKKVETSKVENHVITEEQAEELKKAIFSDAKESETKVVKDDKKSESKSSSKTKTEQKSKADEKPIDEEQRYKDETETREFILESIEFMRQTIDKLSKENDELKKANMKSSARIKNLERHENQLYNDLVVLCNKIANTKNETMVWVWKEIKEYSNKFSHYGDAMVMLDIEKLIVEDKIRMREEAEIAKNLEAKKQKAEEDVHSYDGDNISFINGDIVKPKGIKKKDFKFYEDNYTDCVDWVDWIIDELASADNISVIKKRNKSINDMKTEVNGWLDEWFEAFGDDITDMVEDVVNELYEDRDRDKALSDLVAIIDGLDA